MAPGSPDVVKVTPYTGYKVKTYQTIYDKNGGEMARYTFVIYGDVNGDGAVTSMDLLYVKRHILGTKLLEEPYLTAADANRGNDGITSIDLLYIKRHILDIRYIEQ